MAEIELKLALPRSAVTKAIAALARLPGAGKPAEQTLTAVYFDTPKQDLARAKMALRLRAEDGGMVQTLKTASDQTKGRDNGPLSRGEWSDAARGHAPDLAAGKSGRKLAQVLKKLGAGTTLVPQFEIKVTRTKLRLIHAGSAIEAAVDRGEIRAANKGAKAKPQRLAISELELELKDGATDTAALYDLAHQLAQHLPLHVESRSKAERGYALVTARVNGSAAGRPEAVRSPTVALDPGARLGEALCAIGRSYLAQFTANIPAVAAGDGEGVHQMRIALRRLRGVLSSAEKALPPLQYEWADQRLKDVLQSLGPARNWDVLRAQLDQAPGPAHRRTAGHHKLVEAAGARSRAAHACAAHGVMSRAATSAYLELARWFEGLSRPQAVQAPALSLPLDQVAETLLDRQFKRLRKRGRGFAKLSAEQRHKLRIACKNMRYSTEVLAALYKHRAVKRFLKVLKSAQDGLGALNDTRAAHTLLDDVARHQAAIRTPAGEVLGWLDRDAQDAARAAAKDVKRLRKAPAFW